MSGNNCQKMTWFIYKLNQIKQIINKINRSTFNDRFIVNLDDSVTNEGNVTLRPKHVSAGDFTLLNNVTYGDNRLGQTAYMEIEVGT